VIEVGFIQMASTQKIYKESIRVGVLLAGTAGFIDSYTFAFHNMRFASFQSGNLLQFAVNLAAGKLAAALTFFFPIFFFIIGAGLNQIIKRYKFINTIQWEEQSVLIEAFGVLLAAIMEVLNFPTEVILACLAMFMSMQADTFGKLRGAPYATIMSTGNLKTFGAMFASYFLTKEPEYLRKGRNISFVLGGFVAGALLAHFLGQFIGGWAMFTPVLFLFIVWSFVRLDRQDD
jgi:uncharacterized membrane protein YoaK (UPF0700 family)